MPPSTGKRWWRRAVALVKDRCSLILAKNDLEVAVIRSTSHDASSLNYKNIARVFAWAKTSPESSLPPLLALLSGRLGRTRSWVVALKGLLLTHGLLLCSPSLRLLPFDLSSFRDPLAPPAFSAFVRSYFEFVSQRSPPAADPPDADDELSQLRRLQRTQDRLDLLLQVYPYGNDMSAPLILEAMDCVVVEIFDVYSAICNGIAHALITVFGSPSFWKKDAAAQNGSAAIRVLRRAREQSARLTRYFEVCRSLGVLNVSGLPEVDSIGEDDIEELERIVSHGGKPGAAAAAEEEEEKVAVGGAADGGSKSLQTVVSRKWVMFDGEQSGSSKIGRNPFLCSGTPWELHPVYSHHSHCHHQQLQERGNGHPAGLAGWETIDLLAM